MYKKFIFATLLALLSSAAFSTSKDELSSAIESKYQLTTRSALSGQVKKPGTVLYVRKAGLQANKPSTLMKVTLINNGELEQLGGGSFMPGDSGHTLNIGDEMYLYTYKVNKKLKWVDFYYGTVQSHEMRVGGSTKLKPYQLALRFQYDGGLDSVDTQRVLDDVAAYFSTEEEAASSEDNTLRLGQTPEQVVSIMGAPNKKVDLGSKLIYTYDDLKVTFEGGVVTDVQ